MGAYEFVDYENALRDPVARTTRWSGRAKWVYPFSTHVLVNVDAAHWELRPRVRMRLHATAFGVFGAGAITVPMIVPVPNQALYIVAGLAMIVCGIWWYLRQVFTFAFDTASGKLTRTTFRSEPRRVYALQVLDRQVDDRSFMEVSAVLETGEREMLLCHSVTEDAHATAQRLAELLSVPVWAGIAEGE